MLKELQRLCKLMNIPVLRDAPDCREFNIKLYN